MMKATHVGRGKLMLMNMPAIGRAMMPTVMNAVTILANEARIGHNQ
jgi:hypothetical protein